MVVASNIFASNINIYNLNELANLNKNYINKNNIITVNTTPPSSMWNTTVVPGTETTVDEKILGLNDNIKHVIAARFVNLSLVQAPKQLNGTVAFASRKREQENMLQNPQNSQNKFVPGTPPR